VGFLERDFERDHLAEKRNRTKMGQKIHCGPPPKKQKKTQNTTFKISQFFVKKCFKIM
jgi:hypothetical protein